MTTILKVNFLLAPVVSDTNLLEFKITLKREERF